MTYTILQLKEDKMRAYGFMPYGFAKTQGFSIDDYEKTYEGDEDITLDGIIVKFNVNRPADFKGRSLSVSDIIIADGIAYYVDGYGFTKIRY